MLQRHTEYPPVYIKKVAVLIVSDPIVSIFSCFIRSHRLYRFIQADDYRIFDDGGVLGKGLILKLFKKFTLWSYRSKTATFIFNSRFVYNQVVSDANRDCIPFNLVHPAINQTIFNTTSSKCEDKITISLIARKHPWKGVSTFVNMWHKLPEKYKKLVDEVIFVSHDDLSAYDLKDIKVVVPNSDLDIAEVYNRTNIFISTSWWEGFGLPPLEAMACGCSVISSDSGGVNEYIADGKNALLFIPKNEQELMGKLEQLLLDKQLRNTLAQNALHSAKKFSWERSKIQLLEILNSNI